MIVVPAILDSLAWITPKELCKSILGKKDAIKLVMKTMMTYTSAHVEP